MRVNALDTALALGQSGEIWMEGGRKGGCGWRAGRGCEAIRGCECEAPTCIIASARRGSAALVETVMSRSCRRSLAMACRMF